MFKATLLSLVVFSSTVFAESPSPSPSPNLLIIQTDIAVVKTYTELRSGIVPLTTKMSTVGGAVQKKIDSLNAKNAEFKKEWTSWLVSFGLKSLVNSIPDVKLNLRAVKPPTVKMDDYDILIMQLNHSLALLRQLDEGNAGEIILVEGGMKAYAREDHYQYKNLWAYTIQNPSDARLNSIDVVVNWNKVVKRLFGTAVTLYSALAEDLAQTLFWFINLVDWNIPIPD